MPKARQASKHFTTQWIPADSIARAVAYAIEQPENVAVNEITICPTKQEF